MTAFRSRFDAWWRDEVARNHQVASDALRENLRRVQWLGMAIVPVNLVHVILFWSRPEAASRIGAQWKLAIGTTHCAMAAVVVVLVALSRWCERSARWRPRVASARNAATFSASLGFSVVFVAIDQWVTPSITPYLIGCMLTGVVFLLRPVFAAVLYAFAFSFCHWALGLTQIDEAILLSNRLNALTASVLGLALSVVLWRKHAVTVTLEQEVERQRAALVARQEELHFLATRDSLTGLYNRAEFINLANGELTRAARHGFETAIVVIDLDHFKVVNDTLGHPAGDRVLRSVGAVLSAELRASDVIGRLGGEEFIVLLPQTPPALARSVAEKLRARLAESTLDPESPALRITASFGVASASPQDGSADFEAIYQRADAALYRAKGDGRNRVCVADAGQPGA